MNNCRDYRAGFEMYQMRYAFYAVRGGYSRVLFVELFYVLIDRPYEKKGETVSLSWLKPIF